MAWYDLNNDNISKAENNEDFDDYKRRVKYDEIICEKSKSFEKIIEAELLPNIQYRFVTKKSFNAIVVLDYLLKNYVIVELIIAVYRMNELSVNKLKSIIDNSNIQCYILLSDFFRENKRYERWCENLIMYANEKQNVNIAFANNHAKVFITKTQDEKYIVFEGSGNLSDNARIEQYLIEDNKQTYNFHKEWILETINKNK
jgi:hypothetical protein